MQKLLFIILVFLNFWTGIMYGQGLNTTYDFGDNNLGLGIKVLSDGYIIAATGFDANLTYNIAKVDTLGNIVWHQQLGNADEGLYPFYFDPFHVDPSGNIYIVGAHYDSSYTENLLVAKLNSDGDSVWVKHIDTSTFAGIYDLCLDTINNKLYAIGFDAINSWNEDARTVLWVLDTSGNTILLKYFPDDSFLGSRIWLTNDTLYIGGFTRDSMLGYEPSITKMDTNGIILQTTLYGTDGKDNFSYIEHNHGKSVMITQLDTLQTYLSAITLLDADLVPIWRKVLPDSTHIYNAKAQADGSILFVGVYNHLHGKGIIGKLDSLGNLMWTRKYMHKDTLTSYERNVFYDFDVEHSTGNIILVGEGRNNSQDVWLLKVDSIGCSIPDCDTIIPTGLPVITTATDFNFSFYPNPTNAQITVVINRAIPTMAMEISIIDVIGKEHYYSTFVPNEYGFVELSIDVTDLVQGTYLLKLKQENHTHLFKRLIVQ